MGVCSYLGLCDNSETSHHQHTPPQHGGDTCVYKNTHILDLGVTTLLLASNKNVSG
jgi:hypothetical protein